MPVVEFMQDVLQGGFDGGIVHGEHPGENVEQAPAGFGVTGGFDHDGGHEGAQENALRVGAELEGLAADVHVWPSP